MQGVGGAHRGTVQAFGAGHVHVSFVDRNHLQLRRKGVQDFINLGGVVAVTIGMTVTKMAWGQSLAAVRRGMAECTPNLRAA